MIDFNGMAFAMQYSLIVIAKIFISFCKVEIQSTFVFRIITESYVFFFYFDLFISGHMFMLVNIVYFVEIILF